METLFNFLYWMLENPGKAILIILLLWVLYYAVMIGMITWFVHDLIKYLL